MTAPLFAISLAGLISFATAVAEHVEGDALKVQSAGFQAQLAQVKGQLAQSKRACDLRQADIDGTGRALLHLLGGSKPVTGGL